MEVVTTLEGTSGTQGPKQPDHQAVEVLVGSGGKNGGVSEATVPNLLEFFDLVFEMRNTLDHGFSVTGRPRSVDQSDAVTLPR